MSITVLWDDPEQTILRYVFDGKWEWPELYAALETGARAKNTRSIIVDSIYDMERGVYVPAGVFSQFRRIARTRHRNDGVYIGVAKTPIARSIFNMFCANYGEVAPRYYLVDMLEGARVVVAKQRAWRKQHST